VNLPKIEAGIRLVLEGLDCNLKDENFADTPARVARAYRQIFYSPEKQWNTFDETYTDVVFMRGHKMATLCPHHLLPVYMKVYLAYRPRGRVIGLSKMARVCHEVNQGPMLQEVFTYKVPELLMNLTGATDAACLVRGVHGCMQLRGIKSEADTVTTKFFGVFEDNGWQTRFFNLLGKSF
jgi:GTP cyclohydrolase I